MKKYDDKVIQSLNNTCLQRIYWNQPAVLPIFKLFPPILGTPLLAKQYPVPRRRELLENLKKFKSLLVYQRCTKHLYQRDVLNWYIEKELECTSQTVTFSLTPSPPSERDVIYERPLTCKSNDGELVQLCVFDFSPAEEAIAISK